jgi:glucan phosphorylase
VPLWLRTRRYSRHGEAPSVLEELESVLDPGVLTIGFARRFATYKRAGLIFTDNVSGGFENQARDLRPGEKPRR